MGFCTYSICYINDERVHSGMFLPIYLSGEFEFLLNYPIVSKFILVGNILHYPLQLHCSYLVDTIPISLVSEIFYHF